jgi:hypothetical protein
MEQKRADLATVCRKVSPLIGETAKANAERESIPRLFHHPDFPPEKSTQSGKQIWNEGNNYANKRN